MATMGQRRLAGNKVLSKHADKTLEAIPAMVINLVTSPIEIQPIATYGFLPPTIGGPIMREGFLTETGFLLSSACCSAKQTI
jgi:hypothetical protein